MSKKATLWIFVLAILAVAGSCRPRIPVGIMSESEMEDVLYDYHLAQGAAEQEGGDVDKNRYLYVQAVFAKHGITEAEFDSSMVWYAAHSSRLEAVYQRLYERYNNEMTGMGVGVGESELVANLSENGDTTDIWTGSRILVLQNDYLHGLSVLTMKADSTFLPGDNYALHFHASFLGSGSQAFAFLSVFFKDGSVKSEYRPLRGSYDYKIALPDDITHNTRETERIQIMFYFTPDEAGSEHAFMCVENPILARIHNKNHNQTSSDDVAQTDSAGNAIDSIATDTAQLKRPELAPVRNHEEREGFNLDREKAVRRPMRSNNRVRRRLN